MSGAPSNASGRTTTPLDRDGIAARIPHAGSMCLLSSLDGWDDARVACRATSHRDPSNPLRTRSGLLATAAIEYAAQAMALHGALLGEAAGVEATPGYLASARGVRCAVLRLDDLPIEADDDTLLVEATRQAGDARQLLYAFAVSHAGRRLVDGRAAVVLNTPVGLDGGVRTGVGAAR